MLTRFSSSILLIPHDDILTPHQETVQRELSSPLPYHRTKTLHNIEHARTLLLQLEHAAQNIKVQRVKRDVARDLAQQRVLIKKLRSRVEEFGREAEARGRAWMQESSDGETVEQLLGRPPSKEVTNQTSCTEEGLQASSRPAALEVDIVDDYTSTEPQAPPTNALTTAKDSLLNLRSRKGGAKAQSQQDTVTATATATGSAFSSLPSTERALLADSRTHEDLTSSLVSMATQLKQSARNFQASLDSDRALLDRALDGLDKNVSGMEIASKRMGMLRRMSEAKGWWGRIMLYAWIAGLWLVAVGLVFIGPKFRF